MCQSYFFLLQESIFVQTKAYINFIAFSPVPLGNMQDFFRKLTQHFFLSCQQNYPQIQASWCYLGSQAGGSVISDQFYTDSSLLHIVLYIYPPGCRNKKTIWSFRGLVSVGAMDFIAPQTREKSLQIQEGSPDFQIMGSALLLSIHFFKF